MEPAKKTAVFYTFIKPIIYKFDKPIESALVVRDTIKEIPGKIRFGAGDKYCNLCVLYRDIPLFVCCEFFSNKRTDNTFKMECFFQCKNKAKRTVVSHQIHTNISRIELAVDINRGGWFASIQNDGTYWAHHRQGELEVSEFNKGSLYNYHKNKGILIVRQEDGLTYIFDTNRKTRVGSFNYESEHSPENLEVLFCDRDYGLALHKNGIVTTFEPAPR
jgi:hypothetical protein